MVREIRIDVYHNTPERLVERAAEQIKADHDYWTNVMLRGSHDPYWPDGMVMNATRGHIIRSKKLILAACRKFGLVIPAAYYLPTPPEVDDKFMSFVRGI